MRKVLELPRLSRSERDRRWALVRKRMQERGLDAIVLWGWATMWDFYTANARYLCPVGGNAEFNVLVFPASGEPTCFVQMPTFVEGWRSAQDWVGDIRARGATWADTVAKRITELGLGNGNIGMDGLAGPLDPDGWLPHSVYVRLKELLPQARLVEIGDMLEQVRAIKSAEEIDMLDRAAGLGDLMLQACRESARPGVKECEVYGRMVEVMLSNGGEEPTLFLWACDRHPYPHPFRVPTTRAMETGDVIICEIHPKYGGYFTHVERTFCLGEPDVKQREIYAGCVAAYERGLALFGPGCKISDDHGGGPQRDRWTRPCHLRDRHPRPRPRLARISALSPPRAQGRPGRAESDWRRVPGGHGVRVQHRSLRSQMAQRRDRLRVRRDHPHHRDGRVPDARLSDRAAGAIDLMGTPDGVLFKID